MVIHQLIFSPTGGTKRASEYLCSGMKAESVITRLCVKEQEMKLPKIEADDIVIIAMPVFVGRIPQLAIKRLRNINSNNARCIIMAVYGNRACDDALLELQDTAQEMGFRVRAAVSAIAEHSVARVYGTGRPDTNDREVLKSFGIKIFDKLTSEADTTNQLSLPGNRPYRDMKKGPFPEADVNCTGCETCAAECPTNAISLENLRSVDKNLCISCMRCVKICPKHARNIGSTLDALTQHLRPLCMGRKENELFI